MSTDITNIILLKNNISGDIMKIRRKEYGSVNLGGKKIESLRKAKGIKQKDFVSKMQVLGCDINPTSYSKLEGQIRVATDKELFAISKILDVSIDSLFE